MNKLNNYYENLKMTTSAEEMAQRVASAPAESSRIIAFKKPAVIAAAAAVVLVGGVTAGAVTGLISFNDIFTYTSAENQQLSDNLAGIAENVTTSISDEDYEVSLSGVSGSPASLMANFKISRADGQPIACDDNNSINADVKEITLNNGDGFSGSSMSYGSDENGSLDIDWETSLGYQDIIDGKVIVGGEMNISGTVEFTDGGEYKTVDWEMSFDYTPSEQSLKVVKATDTDENCFFNRYVNDEATEPVEFDISAITLNSNMGIIQTPMSNQQFNAISLTDANDIILTKKNGEQLRALPFRNSSEIDNNSYIILNYYDLELRNKLVIDVSELSTITINGTVFELA